MSRFRNLEFPEEGGKEPRGGASHTDEERHLIEAQAAFERGRFETGLRAYAKVLEDNPGNAAAWTGQVRMLIELGEYREAKVWADKAIESFANEPELLAAKAVALARSGDTQAALAFSDAAIEERGATPYVWLARGDVLLARSESRAAYCFDKALALASEHWLYLWLVSRVHSFYRQFARALHFAQRALDAASDRAAVWLQLGQCQLALGMTAAARSSLQQALELDPEGGASQVLNQVRRSGLGDRLTGFWRRWRGR